MSNNEWITDRRPTKEDGDTKGYVWATAKDGNVRIMGWEFAAMSNLAWMPIVPPEPYVKPKRYKVVEFDDAQWGVLRTADDKGQTAYKYVAHSIPWNNREAADEIAAIYERIAP